VCGRVLRIGYNLLGLSPNYAGGTTTFSLGLLQGLSRVAGFEIVVFVTPENACLVDFVQGVPTVTIRVLDCKISWISKVIRRCALCCGPFLYDRVLAWLFRSVAQQIDDLVDVVYIPTTVVFPLGLTTTTVVSMHDIQHVHFPHFFTLFSRYSRYVLYGLSAKRATYLQASSNYIKDDFLRYFRFLKEEQVVVISEGVALDKFGQKLDREPPLNLPEKFLFYPAQMWPHKDHLTVLNALVELRAAHGIDIPLILTGLKNDSTDTVLAYVTQVKLDNVIYLGCIPFEELLYVYQKASFLISASLHESSCLPILEAATVGIPIIATSIAPNVEMSAHLELNLFEPGSVTSLVACLLKVWNQPRLLEAQVRHNSEAVKRYSWDNVAGDYIAFFKSVV
jgi:glycosyltransferase involved in cell wall biosynthesis